MGQYYNIVLKRDEDPDYTAYDRSVDGEYVLAKLMEHSWFLNETMGGICEAIYKTPTHVWWVGDYACDATPPNTMTEEELQHIYAIAWQIEVYKTLSSKKQVQLFHKYLVNHSKKEYISGDTFFVYNSSDNGWCMHPLSLLTAVGNGLGGGDYSGVNKDQIGSWAGDLISVEDTVPEGYRENTVQFCY